MNTVFEILLMLSGSTQAYKPYVYVCDRDFSNLKDSTKIELFIGCSVIRKRKAYSESRLLSIYESDRAIFLTK